MTRQRTSFLSIGANYPFSKVETSAVLEHADASLPRSLQNGAIPAPIRGRKINIDKFKPQLHGSNHVDVSAVSKLADHALLKLVWYVLLRPLRPELDGRPSSAKSL
jgi:hypothetical protein